MKGSHHACLAALALASPLASQEQLWTVDDDGPADFSTIQEAVSAAAEDDVILIRSGFYNRVTIFGKGVTLQGDTADGPVQIATSFTTTSPAITINSTVMGQRVVVRNIETVNAIFNVTPTQAVRVLNCQGPVYFEDCSLDLANDFPPGQGEGIEITDARSVTFDNCTVRGRFVFDSFRNIYLRRSGIVALRSGLTLYGTEVSGSEGPDAVPPLFVPGIAPGAGGHALSLTDCTVYAANSNLAGGDGGSGQADACHPGKNGGDGIAFDAASLIQLHSSTTRGGRAGLGGPGCGLPNGLPGTSLNGPPASVVQLTSVPTTFEATALVHEGENLVLTYTGEPGQVVTLLASFSLRNGFYLPDMESLFHLTEIADVRNLGVIPASGTRQWTIPIPDLGPGVDSLTLACQILSTDAGGTQSLTNPSFFTFLDASL